MICLVDEPMKKHTTFRTGGNAEKFYKVSSAEEILNIIDECKRNNEPYEIIGNGSNLLVSDSGVTGSVIQICEEISNIVVSGDKIYAEAGALLSKIATVARDNSLSGFEFASGIPGTLGGAVVMNAGAYGGEMKEIVEYVDAICEGKVVRISCEDMNFGYRHSLATEKNMIVLGAMIKLSASSKDKIVAEMDRLKKARVEKQPLEYPSAGSTFKRPEGYFAGKLIMDSGLAGYRVGGAMVSPKHCGFVINYDNATSGDVYKLISDVTEIVYEKYKVKLEPEVRMIGKFN